jgi:type IV pilus assembly protein PilW
VFGLRPLTGEFIKRYKSMSSMRSEQGFTLVELLVTIVVSAVVLAGICSTFYSQHTSYLTQEQIVSMQQNLRVAMYIMERAIRMAGHDPDGDSGAGILAANAGSIRIAQDLTNNAGTGIPDGDVGDPGEDITFSLQDADGDGDMDLVRIDHNSAGVQMIAEDIDALNFVYLNQNGVVTTVPGDIRSVQISVLARTGRPSRGYRNNTVYRNQLGDTIFIPLSGDQHRRRLLTAEVKCRNLGLE